MKEITINRPPANTFGWLRVNGTSVAEPEAVETAILELREGEERVVVLEAAPASKVEAGVGKNASLSLIQISRGGEGARLNDVRVRCAENARFSWYRVVLGGARTYDNCSVSLEGDGGAFSADIGYRLGGTERLDVNCEVVHIGKRTESAVRASGVLSDSAFKLFRGTIDFRTGCAGSVGNEAEEVLLLDETVHNQTVPVILCGEEDVEGNHGATIGQLDEELVYYLSSRGMTREQVYELMARARIEAVVRRIPDETVVRELLGEDAL